MRVLEQSKARFLFRNPWPFPQFGLLRGRRLVAFGYWASFSVVVAEPWQSCPGAWQMSPAASVLSIPGLAGRVDRPNDLRLLFLQFGRQVASSQVTKGSCCLCRAL